MRTRRQKLLEDGQTILGRSNADENSLPIPTDLMYEIFFRLSPKYIARCRCVSKRWASILARQDFTDQFLKQSFLRPQLLFACEKDGKVTFFSSPQPQNPDENSSPVTANYHMSLHLNHVYHIPSPISGWVCIGNVHVLNKRKAPVMLSLICNPSTRQYFTLPKMKTRKRCGKRSFFGYDPIVKQFKVLSLAWLQGKYDAVTEEHQVLTLETGKLSWRMIECNIPHYPGYNHVCIDGVLYYKAKPYHSSSEVMIICFDVRFENFRFIKATEPVTGAVRGEAILINYKGKLASLKPKGSYFFGGACTSFEIWVLDDQKKEWSMHSYKLPSQWQTIVPKSGLNFVGVTGSNEIVFSEHNDSSNPFYVFYYSLEKETIRRVEIQGMGEFVKHRVYTFLNHVEDVKLMKGVLGL